MKNFFSFTRNMSTRHENYLALKMCEYMISRNQKRREDLNKLINRPWDGEPYNIKYPDDNNELYKQQINKLINIEKKRLDTKRIG